MRMPKRSCSCISCRNRADRVFWAVLFASYTTTELDQMYQQQGILAKLLICEASNHGTIKEEVK